MRQGRVAWEDRRELTASIYVWKGRLLSCARWVLMNESHTRACEIESNGRGYTVDYYCYDAYGAGTILTFSSVGSYDLLYRRIYTNSEEACRGDALAWVNDWQAPCGGIEGGILLSLDEWGNEVAV